jgi:hypothetical protein
MCSASQALARGAGPYGPLQRPSSRSQEDPWLSRASFPRIAQEWCRLSRLQVAKCACSRAPRSIERTGRNAGHRHHEGRHRATAAKYQYAGRLWGHRRWGWNGMLVRRRPDLVRVPACFRVPACSMEHRMPAWEGKGMPDGQVSKNSGQQKPRLPHHGTYVGDAVSGDPCQHLVECEESCQQSRVQRVGYRSRHPLSS